ncbi:MAG: YggS family pyridoxal phosphate-dependent enzyme [Ardenticatenaceae bacterium]|nr:YggS family pyridoxal phosphate-dependent enzyme [Ardenticatenaceae bacterium]
MTTIAQRYEAVQERIAAAAARAGRPAAEITLVAVTKTWPAEVLLAAYAAGMRHFGENRTVELAEKRPFIEAQLGNDSGIVWEFIGTLQSRQSQVVADLADSFHALDRLKIAARLSRQLAENGRFLPVYLEINVSGEASKSGFQMSNWENDATQREELRKAVETINHLPGLRPVGLMTMAPWEAPDGEIRAVFRRTRLLRDWLETAVGVALPQLSMGMTDDFEMAIEEGATHVRVGRALFGSRQ